jgi:hypothetical protein
MDGRDVLLNKVCPLTLACIDAINRPQQSITGTKSIGAASHAESKRFMKTPWCEDIAANCETQFSIFIVNQLLMRDIKSKLRSLYAHITNMLEAKTAN